METKPVNWPGRKPSCRSERALAQSTPFSGRGEIPHRRYAGMTRKPASGPGLRGVSRSGEKPEPTVTVRMKENVQRAGDAARLPVIALGDVSVTKGDHDDTHPLCFYQSQLAFRYR